MLSLVTRVCQLKHLTYRRPVYLKMHLALVSALFKMLLAPNRLLEPEASLMTACSTGLSILSDLGPMVR